MGLHRASERPARVGLSLVEVLIVIALLGVVLGVALPALQPQTADQVLAAAQRLVADLDYVRQLAITNNTTYAVLFDPAKNEYRIEHSGAATAWHVLPTTVHFTSLAGSAGRTQWVVPVGQPLTSGISVELREARREASGSSLDRLDFQPLGHIEPGERVVVWLAGGAVPQRRYVPVYVERTGFVWAGDLSVTAPSP